MGITLPRRRGGGMIAEQRRKAQEREDQVPHEIVAVAMSMAVRGGGGQ